MAVLGKMVGDSFSSDRLVSLVNRVFKEEDFDEVLLQNYFTWKLKPISGWCDHIWRISAGFRECRHGENNNEVSHLSFLFHCFTPPHFPWGCIPPQNGHFWGSLFSSLFFSDRSKWDFWGSRKRPKMSHHAMHVVPCNFLNSMSYNAMQCYAMPYHPMSCHAMECNDKQCHATPYHARLCNATPHKAITCWGIKRKVWSDGIVI